ncbi:MAG: fibronectin type III domain-containing protein [Gemmatimonadetes bacterium]|nr:fibronectin type III domain-containing protein [Gemmatimonadota bacterium]
MARFPKAEAQILALARRVIQGLRDGADDFPNLPVSADELQALLDECYAAIAATTAAKSAFHEEHARKDRALARLVAAMKAVLRYAEVIVRRHPEKLIRLGWGTRRPRTPLQAPGEVRNTRILAEADTYLTLAWNPPVDGGAVVAYTIQCKRNGTPWKDLAVCTDTQYVVKDQPRGVELEYRVYAVNKAGIGLPGSVVTAVL